MQVSWRSGLKAALKVLAVAMIPSLVATAALAANPDLIITKDGPVTVSADTDVTYTIVVINLGDGSTPEADSASNAVMNDPLPPGMTFVSASWPGDWECAPTPAVGSNGTVHCTSPSMAEGNATFTVIAHVEPFTAPGTYFTNIATASWSCGDEICDPNDENNSAVSVAQIAGPTADMGVTITGPEYALPDTDVTYTITAISGGPDNASDATWSMVLPGNMTFVDVSSTPGSTCAYDGLSLITCVAGPPDSFMAAGGVSSATVVGHIPPSAPEGTTYQATVHASTTTPDVNNENDSSTTMLTVLGNADLSAAVSGPATANVGDTITYAVTVQNNGPSLAVNAVLSDTLPSGVTFSSIDIPSGWQCSTPALGSSGTITCTRYQYPSGLEQQFNIEVLAAGAGLATSSVSITSSAGEPNSVDNDALVSTAINGGAPGITVTSSANPSEFGSSVTLTATVPGIGATPTGNVTFLDGASSLATVSLASGEATFTTSSLAVGSHNVTVQYSGDSYYDPATSALLVQKVTPPGTLALEIGFGSDAFVSAGETIQLRYTLSNTGTVAITGMSVADAKASGISCPATDLAIGGTMTCSATYVVTDADVTAGTIAFEATASGNGGEMVTSTASITGGAEIVSDAFETMTRGFVETRQKLIAAAIDTPSLNDRKDKSSVSLHENDGQAVLNFVATSADLWDRGPGAALASGGDGSPLTFWIDGTLALHTRSDAEGGFGLVGVGADYLVSPELLAGVALYVDFMRDVGNTGEITGNGALAGPYVSVGIADGLTLDAALYYGRSWNDAEANLLGSDYSGSFETERFIAEIELEGEWLIDQLTVRPRASLYLANETADSYTVTNGMGGSVEVDGFSVATIQLGTGLSVERTFVLDNGLELTPEVGGRIGMGGSGDELILNGAFGGVGAGLTLAGESWALRGTLDLGADATGLSSSAIRAQLTGSF